MSTNVDGPLDIGPPLDFEPGSGRRLRYMGRRRINRLDRNGDPLDGVVNLFDVAIVLAVAFLLAALTGIGLSGILTSKDFTIVTNPGQTDMQIITKKGATVTKLDLNAGQQVTGLGTLIGQFYRLPDGTTVYVPSGASTSPTTGSTPGPVVTPTPPGVQITPAPTSTPPVGAPGTTSTTAPSNGSTLQTLPTTPSQ